MKLFLQAFFLFAENILIEKKELVYLDDLYLLIFSDVILIPLTNSHCKSMCLSQLLVIMRLDLFVPNCDMYIKFLLKLIAGKFQSTFSALKFQLNLLYLFNQIK